jgi:NAD(P)-dependent dehydrogenase (short-subunit alcohol dehydrogenase family)
MANEWEFAGRTALITGGGSGIGREVAQLLGREKVRVAIADRTIAAAEETVKLVRQAGGEAKGYELDVTQSAKVTEIVKRVEGDLGPLSHTVSLAGIYGTGAIETISDEDWFQQFQINCFGAFYLCRAALPGMMERRFGTIVNMSSIHAVRGQAMASHYAAAKGAVASFTKSLAIEKAPYNIRANAVAPGPIDTPLWRGQTPPEQLDGLKRERSKIIPMARLGDAIEVANVIVFLLSPQASYMTGQVIRIDGGEAMAG